MLARRRVAMAVCLAAAAAAPTRAHAAVPVVVPNVAGFEGEEEPTVIYYPGSLTFQNDSYFLPQAFQAVQRVRVAPAAKAGEPD